MDKVMTDEGLVLESELARVADFFKPKTHQKPDPDAFNPKAFKAVSSGEAAQSVKK